jgi:hypothetical protein
MTDSPRYNCPSRISLRLPMSSPSKFESAHRSTKLTRESGFGKGTSSRDIIEGVCAEIQLYILYWSSQIPLGFHRFAVKRRATWALGAL